MTYSVVSRIDVFVGEDERWGDRYVRFSEENKFFENMFDTI